MKKKKLEQNLKWATAHLSRRLGAQGRGRWGGRQAGAGAGTGRRARGRQSARGRWASRRKALARGTAQGMRSVHDTGLGAPGCA